MNIHHATRKSLEALGASVTIRELDGRDYAEAVWESRTYSAYDPKTLTEAVKLQKAFQADYPALSVLRFVTEHDNSEVRYKDAEGTETVIYTGADTPSLADILDTCLEKGLDPETGYQEPQRGTVVANHYKLEYAARGDASSCGDWLAMQLPKIQAPDWQELEAIFIENGVPMAGKWATLPTSGQSGWFGRYRMNGRQKLEMVVATRGTLILRGQLLKAPIEFLEAMLTKHPKITPEWTDAV